jgi:hypothetical protein
MGRVGQTAGAAVAATAVSTAAAATPEHKLRTDII